MTQDCRNCGGDIEEVPQRSGYDDGAYIRYYRCTGRCRQGGHTVHPSEDADPVRRVGPIYWDGAAHTIHGPELEDRVRTDGGSVEEQQQGSACECIVKNEWGDDTEECLVQYTGVNSNNAYHGLNCSRPAGHDGPHAACSYSSHPVMVWPQDDEEETEDRVRTDGGHRKAWQSTSVDVVESDVIVHNNGDETYGVVLDLGDIYVAQVIDMDGDGFRDGDVIAATRTEDEATRILEDWETDHVNGLAPDNGWKQLFK